MRKANLPQTDRNRHKTGRKPLEWGRDQFG